MSDFKLSDTKNDMEGSAYSPGVGPPTRYAGCVNRFVLNENRCPGSNERRQQSICGGGVCCNDGGRHRAHRRTPAPTPNSNTTPVAIVTSPAPPPVDSALPRPAAIPATTMPSTHRASLASTTATVMNTPAEAAPKSTTMVTTPSRGGATTAKHGGGDAM